MTMNLSQHFTLEELTHSDVAVRKGIENTPDAEIIEVLKRTAAGLEEVRELLDCPIHVNSGYRSLKLNSAIGSTPTSQHVKGEAVDFIAPQFGTPQEICRAILDSTIQFDQLIAEGNWVHISFTDVPRHSVLTARFENGKANYTQGIS